MILVTGGAGFIGSNFVRHYLDQDGRAVINLDKLTYAGNPANLAEVKDRPDYHFVHGDINNGSLLCRLFHEIRPTAVVHFAAETHVDRSIAGPAAFVETNVNGTFCLLEAALEYWNGLPTNEKAAFRFLHVSTDEVYGSLSLEDPPFTENSQYQPSSPYSASKAAADHMVRAYYHTYGLPTIISNCSNNYGPYQHPEKLIPITIVNALAGKALPLYGQGVNERNWLHVKDHCDALERMLHHGRPGELYLVGSDRSRSNREVMDTICRLLDDLSPKKAICPHDSLIRSVTDRPGHDLRYDIDSSKIGSELGWAPQTSFEDGLRQTVQWYLDNSEWVNGVVSGEYRHWIQQHYGETSHA